MHPIVRFPRRPDVLDLTVPPAARSPRRSPYSVGRYDEDRVGVYTQAHFADARTVHVGLDLGGPVGTPVFVLADGRITHRGYNPAPGDYGYTVITEHWVSGAPLWVLHGHLSAQSAARWVPGDAVREGEVLGWLGAAHDNGGWAPHVHVQCAVSRPCTHDLPGVVARAERSEALRRWPDPTRISGVEHFL